MRVVIGRILTVYKVVPRLSKKQLWDIIMQSLGLLAIGEGGGERRRGGGKVSGVAKTPKLFYIQRLKSSEFTRLNSSRWCQD